MKPFEGEEIEYLDYNVIAQMRPIGFRGRRSGMKLVLALAFVTAIAALASPAASQLPEDIRIDVVQLLLPLPRDAAAEEIARRAADAKRIVDQVSHCEDLRSIAQRTPDASVSAKDWLRVGDLPANIAQQLMAVPIGRAVGPFALHGTIQIVAVCSRVQGPAEPPPPPRPARRRPPVDAKN